MTATTAFTERQELAHRISDGIEVTLLWSKATNRVTIAVLDSQRDERLEFDVDGSAALDAFTTRTRTPPPLTPETSPSRAWGRTG